MNFLIEHQCPQCGAPAVLDEDERLFTCPYCRVHSYLLGGKYFRYLFSHKADASRDILYFPYWRFKGMIFTCTMSGIEDRFIDASHQAFDSAMFPISVGLRPQALKLKFALKETPGSFIPAALSMNDAMTLIENRLELPKMDSVLYRAYIGESLNLIYAPFYIKERLHDAILNTPLSTDSDETLLSALPREKPSWAIRFIPTLCPDCGWDLEGDKLSQALICRNCQSVWQTTQKGLLKLKFGRIQGRDPEAVYLPFWRIRTELSGIRIDSFADLVQLANLPKAIQPYMHDQPFFFWVQAFKTPPQIFLQIARNFTLSQLRLDHEEVLPEPGKIHPITLPVTEAVESLKLILASMAKPAKKILPRLPAIHIKPLQFKLVYIPFVEGHHELIQPDNSVTIHKNMLAMSKNL